MSCDLSPFGVTKAQTTLPLHRARHLERENLPLIAMRTLLLIFTTPLRFSWLRSNPLHVMLTLRMYWTGGNRFLSSAFSSFFWCLYIWVESLATRTREDDRL